MGGGLKVSKYYRESVAAVNWAGGRNMPDPRVARYIPWQPHAF
jgi:hypothetical protein